MAALGICFPKTFSSAGRMFAAPTSRLYYFDVWIRFHNKEVDEMPCKLESTENLFVRDIPNHTLRAQEIVPDRCPPTCNGTPAS